MKDSVWSSTYFASGYWLLKENNHPGSQRLPPMVLYTQGSFFSLLSLSDRSACCPGLQYS